MADGPLAFFDCEMGVGRSGLGFPLTPTAADALAVMERYGIAEALVYDRHALESGVFDRFDEIVSFCATSPRLHPSIHVVPPATGEQPPPERLVDQCLANGVKALRACPSAHNYLCDSHSMGSLLAAMERRRVPLVHTSMQVQDHPWLHAPPWPAIREIALAFPRLPVVVLYTGMLQNRNLLPLLAECPNVLADLTCTSFQFVERVVETVGSTRLVLASHYPTEDPGLYTPWLTYAGVGAADLARIAGDNIRRLLAEAR